MTLGSVGDIRPFVALGVALRAAGHDARIASHESYAPLYAEHGIELHGLPGDPDALLETGVGQSLLGAGRDPLRNLRDLARIAEELLDRLLVECLAACRGADLVICNATALVVGGLPARARISVPVAGGFLQPVHPTSEFASVLLPGWPFERLPGRGLYNALSHRLVQQLTWQLIRRRVNRLRERELGLTPLPFRGPYGELRRPGWLWLYGYSPSLLPRPQGWPASARVTGYW